MINWMFLIVVVFSMNFFHFSAFGQESDNTKGLTLVSVEESSSWHNIWYSYTEESGKKDSFGNTSFMVTFAAKIPLSGGSVRFTQCPVIPSTFECSSDKRYEGLARISQGKIQIMYYQSTDGWITIQPIKYPDGTYSWRESSKIFNLNKWN